MTETSHPNAPEPSSETLELLKPFDLSLAEQDFAILYANPAFRYNATEVVLTLRGLDRSDAKAVANARDWGHRTLQKLRVKLAVDALRQHALADYDAMGKELLEQWRVLANLDLTAFDEGDLSDLPADLRLAVQGIEHTKHGRKLVLQSKQKAQEMLAKAIGLLGDSGTREEAGDAGFANLRKRMEEQGDG